MNKEFAITDLFTVTGSVTTPKLQLNLSKYPDSEHPYPYITTQSIGNGIAGYSNTYTEDGNVLTVDSAVLGTCFYQKNPFTASDHVEKLIPKFDMDETLAMYFVAVMNKMAVELGYSYQKKRSQKALRGETLILPVDDNGNPDAAKAGVDIASLIGVISSFVALGTAIPKASKWLDDVIKS